MNRYTEIWELDNGLYGARLRLKVDQRFRTHESDNWTVSPCMNGDYIIQCRAIDRLAEYEDLGLTPKEIKERLKD